jgi:hypothetical protein
VRASQVQILPFRPIHSENRLEYRQSIAALFKGVAAAGALKKKKARAE